MLTSDTFTIRAATAHDYPAVVACVEAAFSKWVAIIGMKPFALMADYHDTINRHVVYLLENHHVVPAVVGVLIIWPVDDALYVDTIAVDPTFQKQGLGRRLLTFAEEKAREARLYKLTLVTNEKMIANQDYYRKFGYSETHRQVFQPGRVGVWMAKTLAPE